MPRLPRRSAVGRTTTIDAALLRAWPLPSPAGDGDKSDRGQVVCIGGAPELPGAIILAGTAALRAGAGLLRMGTARSIARAVAVAVPEALVFGVTQTRAGGLAPSSAASIAQRSANARALLIGPGMVDVPAVLGLLRALLPRLAKLGVLIIDAAALDGVAAAGEALWASGVDAVLTPHAGEMARLLDVDIASVKADPVGMAARAAAEFRAVVALKGSDTYVVTPTGETYCYREGDVGLATSGSGDTLAGVIAGLAARGASPDQAAAWGVYLHGAAGNRLTGRMGRIGFLARELLAEVPPVMASFDDNQPCRQTRLAGSPP